MNATEFVTALDTLRPHEPACGRILLGTQTANGTFPGCQPFDGVVPPQATHINTGLFRPEVDGRWYERGHLVNRTLGLLLDDQGNPEKAETVPTLKPTAKVWTSEGSEQWLYVYNEKVEPQRGKAMAVGAALAGLSDDFISNRHHHWWRLPGSLPEPKIRQGRTHPAKLLEWSGATFGYDALAEALEIEPRDGSLSHYRGSWEFDRATAEGDPVWQWLDGNGHTETGYATHDFRGFRNVMCPNHLAHTDQLRPWGRYVPPNAMSAGGYVCHHTHCNASGKFPRVTLDDLRQWVAQEGGPSVAEAQAYASLMWKRQRAADFVRRAKEMANPDMALVAALKGMKS